MTLNSHAKFKEKLTCCSKYDMRNLVNFHPTTQKSGNFPLMGYFCAKHMYEVWAKKIQRNNPSWQWTVMQYLNKPWPWEIGWIFFRALTSLKNCTLISSFCPKHVSVRKFRRNYVSWQWRMLQSLKGILTCGLKNDIRNSANFHASSRNSKSLHFNWILLSKAYKDLGEKVQKMESDAMFEEKLTLGSKNDMRNLLNLNASSCKSGNFHFNMLLLSIAYKVSA